MRRAGLPASSIIRDLQLCVRLQGDASLVAAKRRIGNP
jgi:hypothetical protein